MMEADDPTMSYIDRLDQWHKVEVARGYSTVEAVACSRVEALETLDSEMFLDPAAYNEWLQSRLREDRHRHPAQ
jgi:hypothetical protein